VFLAIDIKANVSMISPSPKMRVSCTCHSLPSVRLFMYLKQLLITCINYMQ
jgi:hypothetical protein